MAGAVERWTQGLLTAAWLVAVAVGLIAWAAGLSGGEGGTVGALLVPLLAVVPPLVASRRFTPAVGLVAGPALLMAAFIVRDGGAVAAVIAPALGALALAAVLTAAVAATRAHHDREVAAWHALQVARTPAVLADPEVTPPSMLREGGLDAALGVLVGRLSATAWLHGVVGRRLDPSVEHLGLRFVSEVVENALEHAGADRIDVFVALDPGALRVEVWDDGRLDGLEPSAALGDLRARVTRRGGSLTALRRPGVSVLTMLVPVDG